jgi:hypothetical protein
MTNPPVPVVGCIWYAVMTHSCDVGWPMCCSSLVTERMILLRLVHTVHLRFQHFESSLWSRVPWSVGQLFRKFELLWRSEILFGFGEENSFRDWQFSWPSQLLKFCGGFERKMTTVSESLSLIHSFCDFSFFRSTFVLFIELFGFTNGFLCWVWILTRHAISALQSLFLGIFLKKVANFPRNSEKTVIKWKSERMTEFGWRFWVLHQHSKPHLCLVSRGWFRKERFISFQFGLPSHPVTHSPTHTVTQSHTHPLTMIDEFTRKQWCQNDSGMW